MSWNEICSNKQYRGRWVALDSCRYDGPNTQPSEGTVVDADDDLAELCNRMKKSNQRSCAILFCAGLLSSFTRRSRTPNSH